MPVQSGASEIKPGKNWINRGKDLRPQGAAASPGHEPAAVSSYGHIEAAAHLD
jgi:hypothetical protein